MAIKAYLKNEKKFYEVIVKERDKSGHQIMKRKRGIQSERVAREVEFEFKKELDLILNSAPLTDWQSWFDRCMKVLAVQFLPSTLIGYQSINEKWVKSFLGDKDISKITTYDVHEMIFNHLPPHLSQNTRRNILKAVRKVFQMAVDEGILNRNPTTGVTVRVAEVDQKVLTKTEMNTLLSKAKEIEHPFYPIWVFGLATGMRSGEMIALKWTDVDFERGVISVSKQWSSKNGFTSPKARKNRIVPISDSLSTFLKEYKLKAVNGDGFVLPRIREWEHGEQSKVIKGFCEAIGITQIKFHDLRATFITHMLASGVSLVRVMAIVGHSELKTTNGYLRKAGVDVVGATNAMGLEVPSEEGGKVVRITAFR